MTAPRMADDRKGNVLLAEDDDEMRALVRRALTRNGYEVLEAWDGAELITRLVRGSLPGGTFPDFIIADLRMPWSTGLAVLQRMREHGIRTPVILMTAFGDDATREETARLGPARLLDKPFEMGELLDAVRAILA